VRSAGTLNDCSVLRTLHFCDRIAIRERAFRQLIADPNYSSTMTDVAMSPNGLLSPQRRDDRSQSPLPTSAKRKRVNSNEATIHVDSTTEQKTNGAPKMNSQEQINDFITILKRYAHH
jgi:hypothetical protein